MIGRDTERDALIDAFTRLASEVGFEMVDAGMVARAAGLETADFHRHFADEAQCMLAAYDRFIARLLDHIAAACEGVDAWPEKVKVSIETAFEFVTEVEPVARMFAIDAPRIGPAAFDRNCTSIDAAAELLKRGRQLSPSAAGMPFTTERTLVAGVVMLAEMHLLGEEASRLPAVEAEAVEMVLTPYVGSSRAHSLAVA